ncbi:MAG TPA: response regulator transcription factor [Actinomycetota bacterium]|nr:response regulator transcription factor [Actinomycetota bacterium]
MARILLVDSQPLFNEALEALFARDGEHQVVGRSSAPDEAFELVRRLDPDLVLVDAALALADSPSLVERMLGQRRDAKVIALGNDHDPDLLVAALRAGAAGVVAKTHGAGTMLRVARGVLNGEAAVPRGMVLEVFRQLIARGHVGNSPLARLSPRERQVLALLSRGWDNTRIGQTLYISQHTVRTHIQNILEKLGMHSKLEAAAYAMQRSVKIDVEQPNTTTPFAHTR